MMLWSCAVLLSGALATPEPPVATGSAVALDYRIYREWDLLVPRESFSKVGDGFTVDGVKFATAIEGSSLSVDIDGDARMDIEVPYEDAKWGQIVVVSLRATAADGSAVTYAVRITNEDGQGWLYAPSGAMVGKIGDTRIQLIDRNNNGSYADFGEDAIIVGRGKSASLLSRVINVDGQLHELSVNAAGDEVSVKPYEGPAGVFDARTDYQTEGKLAAVIVRSKDGQYSFDLSRSPDGLRVPAGDYELYSGRLVLGSGHVTIKPGRSATLTVPADDELVLTWGGPIDAEFSYRRQGDQLAFSPDEVWYFGAAGEEYVIWAPPGESPAFSVKEKATGDELINVKFPGSC